MDINNIVNQIQNILKENNLELMVELDTDENTASLVFHNKVTHAFSTVGINDIVDDQITFWK